MAKKNPLPKGAKQRHPAKDPLARMASAGPPAAKPDSAPAADPAPPAPREPVARVLARVRHGVTYKVIFTNGIKAFVSGTAILKSALDTSLIAEIVAVE